MRKNAELKLLFQSTARTLMRYKNEDFSEQEMPEGAKTNSWYKIGSLS